MWIKVCTLGIKDKHGPVRYALKASIKKHGIAPYFLKSNRMTADRRTIGERGEAAATQYLRRHGFTILTRNYRQKLGEVDIICRKEGTLHFVEVKAQKCREFPEVGSIKDEYDPTVNLHPQKIRKVARMAEWYVAETEWEGEWQVDGMLVWIRERDGRAYVRYLPQIA